MCPVVPGKKPRLDGSPPQLGPHSGQGFEAVRLAGKVLQTDEANEPCGRSCVNYRRQTCVQQLASNEVREQLASRERFAQRGGIACRESSTRSSTVTLGPLVSWKRAFLTESSLL